MKERICNTWNTLKTVINEKDYTVRESVLAIIVVFLTGIILGAVCSPKKVRHFCSHNGNNNGNNNNGSKGCAEVNPEEAEQEEEQED